CCARFKEHAVGNLAWSAESLGIGETVVSSESTDGLALIFNEPQRRMLPHRIPELLKLSVYGVLSQCGLKRRWIKKDVDIFRKSLDEVPSFCQARPAFENNFATAGVGKDAKSLRNVIILLDDRRSQ